MSSVITAIARTPIGRFGGGLASLPAVELGAVAMAGALERAGLAPQQVDEVIFGHVLQAGTGQITARQAAVNAGIPMTVPATVINKVCLSGMAAIAAADRHIRLGEANFVMAGGMESMSNAPYLVPGARWGLRFGDGALVDSMQHDGLFCAFDQCTMGEQSDAKNADLGISRADQDAWAAASHARAAAATESGGFAGEIVPVPVPQRRGDPVTVDRDEGIRPDATPESMGGLRPAFRPDGTITAGNASQISDGAAAVLVLSADTARELGVTPMARVTAYETAGVDPGRMGIGPVPAVRRLLERCRLSMADVDLVEINEAFAVQVLACVKDLGLDRERLNVNGGAIALGHPIGATGARIVVTLLHEMARRHARRGLATLCVSGGLGLALLVETP